MSPGSRKFAAWSASLRPDAGEAVGLQLQAHRELVALDLADALAHLVHARRRCRAGSARGGRPRARPRRPGRKVAARAELRCQLLEETQVDVELLVRRAIERADRRTPRSRSRFHALAEQHQRRLAVLAAACSANISFQTSSVSRATTAVCWRHSASFGDSAYGSFVVCIGASPAPCSTDVGIAAEEHHEQRDRERAEAAADEPAAADAHAAPVLDVVALPASFPAHGASSYLRTAHAAGNGRRAGPRTGAPGS